MGIGIIVVLCSRVVDIIMMLSPYSLYTLGSYNDLSARSRSGWV